MPNTTTDRPTTCKVETCNQYGVPLTPARSECPTCHTATIAYRAPTKCPDWCEYDHDADRALTDGDTIDPMHAPDRYNSVGTGVYSVQVSIAAPDPEPGEQFEPEVVVEGSAALDARSARDLAAYLIAAAEWLEDHTEPGDGQCTTDPLEICERGHDHTGSHGFARHN